MSKRERSRTEDKAPDQGQRVLDNIQAQSRGRRHK